MEIIDASLEHIPNIVTLNLREYGIPENEALEHFTELQWWGNQELLKWHFSNLQKNGGGILLAIDETGNILGELDYVKSIQEGRYHIIWILVDKEARRKGIAKS
ncbi:MAG: GNAT family N-acetyltransferase, partial [Methanobacteriota archaeon]